MGQRASFEPVQLAVAADFWGALARRKLLELRLSEAPEPLAGYYEAGVRGRPALVHLTHASLGDNGLLPGESSVVRVRVPGTIRLYNTASAYAAADRAALAREARASIEAGGSQMFWMVAHADLKRHVFRYHVLHAAVFESSVWFSVTRRETSADTTQCHGSPVSECGDRIVFVDPSGADFPVFGWPLRNALFLRLVLNDRPFLDVDVVRSDGVTGFRLARECIPAASPGVHVTGWERDAEGRTCERVVDLSALMDGAQLAAEANALNLRLMRWRLAPDVDLGVFGRQRVLIVGAGTLGCNVARLLVAWGVRSLTFVDCGRVSYSNPARQSLFVHADCANGGRSKAAAAADALRAVDPGLDVRGEDLGVPMPGHIPAPGCADAVRRLWDLVDSHDAVFCLTDSRESRWLPTVLAGVCCNAAVTIALGFDTYVAMRHGPSVLDVAFDSESSSRADPTQGVAGGMANGDGGAPIGDACTASHTGCDVRSVEFTDGEGEVYRAQGCAIGDVGEGVESLRLSTANDHSRIRRGSGRMRLGCYFCSDPTAPGDTVSGRTLDQQCTVSRPGVSMMAAAAGVELYASMLQHPDGVRAPAFLAMPSVYDSLDVVDDHAGGGVGDTGHPKQRSQSASTPGRQRGRLSSALGIVPHQIRGFVSHQQQVHLVGAAYDHCTACSAEVLTAVRDGGVEYIVSVLGNPSMLIHGPSTQSSDPAEISELRQEDDFLLV